MGRGCNETLACIHFILLLKLKSPLIVLSKGFLISGYSCKLYLGRKNNWMKCINAGLLFQAFIKLVFFYIVQILQGLQQRWPKFFGEFSKRQAIPCPTILMPFICIRLKVFLLYPSRCSSEETFLLPKYTHSLGLKGLKPTTKFLTPSHHH